MKGVEEYCEIKTVRLVLTRNFITNSESVNNKIDQHFLF